MKRLRISVVGSGFLESIDKCEWKYKNVIKYVQFIIIYVFLYYYKNGIKENKLNFKINILKI